MKHVQKSQKLAAYSDSYRTERDVRSLLDEKLQPFNEGKMDARSTMTLARFVDSHYMPEYVTVELKPSTADGYRKLWDQRLEPLLGDKALREITPKDVFDTLKQLRAKGLGRRSIYHAKALLSGIVAYAVNTGVLHHNPVTQAKMIKTAPPKQTHAATLDEVLDALDALKGKPKARAAVALMYFAGLRPGEARGVRWEDYEATYNYETEQFEWQRRVGPGNFAPSRPQIRT